MIGPGSDLNRSAQRPQNPSLERNGDIAPGVLRAAPRAPRTDTLPAATEIPYAAPANSLTIFRLPGK